MMRRLRTLSILYKFFGQNLCSRRLVNILWIPSSLLTYILEVHIIFQVYVIIINVFYCMIDTNIYEYADIHEYKYVDVHKYEYANVHEYELVET